MEPTGVDLLGKNVVMVVASQNFRDEEFREPAKMLAHVKAGIDVASSSKEPATGMKGMKVTPDLLLTEVDLADYDAVIFVGGSGSSEYFEDPTAHQLAKDAAAEGKPVCAICIAPSTLANAGLLEGKKATCYSSQVSHLKSKGAEVVEEPVVRDGNIITADGPESARLFGRAIVQALAE